MLLFCTDLEPINLVTNSQPAFYRPIDRNLYFLELLQKVNNTLLYEKTKACAETIEYLSGRLNFYWFLKQNNLFKESQIIFFSNLLLKELNKINNFIDLLVFFNFQKQMYEKNEISSDNFSLILSSMMRKLSEMKADIHEDHYLYPDEKPRDVNEFINNILNYDQENEELREIATELRKYFEAKIQKHKSQNVVVSTQAKPIHKKRRCCF